MYVCIYVCVREREHQLGRGAERESEGEADHWDQDWRLGLRWGGGRAQSQDPGLELKSDA